MSNILSVLDEYTFESADDIAKEIAADIISNGYFDDSTLLSDEQKKTVERAMSDPEYLRSLLASEKAQAIIKQLKGEK